MSAENVELVREIYRRLGRDGRFPEELLDPEVEYVNPPDAVEPGTRRGREEFFAAIGRVTDVYRTHVEPHDFIDAGDEVVVLLTHAITGKGSGIERRQPQGHVWSVRAGKGTRFRWFNDPEQALRAAGVEPPPGGEQRA
jgi:ketosteroid isomerase-like protein